MSRNCWWIVNPGNRVSRQFLCGLFPLSVLPRATRDEQSSAGHMRCRYRSCCRSLSCHSSLLLALNPRVRTRGKNRNCGRVPVPPLHAFGQPPPHARRVSLLPSADDSDSAEKSKPCLPDSQTSTMFYFTINTGNAPIRCRTSGKHRNPAFTWRVTLMHTFAAWRILPPKLIQGVYQRCQTPPQARTPVSS